jgi:MoaA/NifB/PqqE/SkfB family radical SAM enzyme
MHSALPHARSLFLKTRPIHLTYFVTARCNGRCPFCFYEDAREAAGRDGELTADEVRRVARSMGPLLWVLFSGGEPFLREDLAELSGIFHDTNRPAFLTFPTNGLLPEVISERTAEILRRCDRSVVVVKLSLDGVGADHDAIRGTPGGFDRLMRAYELLAPLADAHPALELGVNTLFSPENQWRMDGILDFVARRLDRIRSHTVTMLRGGPREARSEDVDLGQYARVTARLEERWGGRGGRFHRFAGARLKAAQDRLQRRLIHRTLSERRRVLPCHAGRLNLVLTERGELHPCEERWDRSFGNVREAGYDVAAMVRSERGQRILREIERPDACWCSHECNFLTNILFNPTMHPALLREWARLSLGARGGGVRTRLAPAPPMPG